VINTIRSLTVAALNKGVAALNKGVAALNVLCRRNICEITM